MRVLTKDSNGELALLEVSRIYTGPYTITGEDSMGQDMDLIEIPWALYGYTSGDTTTDCEEFLIIMNEQDSDFYLSKGLTSGYIDLTEFADRTFYNLDESDVDAVARFVDKRF